MEAEMQAAIATMVQSAEKAANAATAATTAANASTAAANAATAAVHQVSRDVVAIRRDLGILWRKVNGGSTPPTIGDPDRAPAEVAGESPLIDRIDAVHGVASEASLEVAALEGRMIAGLAAVESKVMSELRPQTSELTKQSETMGVDKDGWAYLLRTKAGRQTLLGLATLLVTAIGLIVSAFRPNAPPPPPPAPTVIVAPAPIPSPAVSR